MKPIDTLMELLGRLDNLMTDPALPAPQRTEVTTAKALVVGLVRDPRIVALAALPVEPPKK